MGHQVTALRVQKRNPQRVNVYLDGEYAFGLARIVAAWLQVGQDLSDEKITQLRAEDEYEAAYQHALKFLSYRTRSQAEVRTNLLKRGTPDGVIDEVIERLVSAHLVDDERFARLWVENRSEFRPRSRRALTYELRQRGLDQETIEQSIESLDEDELAYQAAQKQARKLNSQDYETFRQKLLGFLARRGFSYAVSMPVIRRVWVESHGKPDTTDIEDDEVQT